MLELLYQIFVLLECVEQIHVGLKRLFVEFIVIGLVDEDDVQLEAFRNVFYNLAGENDLVEAVDQAWNRFLLDATLRFGA